MKIEYNIDCVALFGKGTDSAGPIDTLDVNPTDLSEGQRALLTRHLLVDGNVCRVVFDAERAKQPYGCVPVGGCEGDAPVIIDESSLECLFSKLEEIENSDIWKLSRGASGWGRDRICGTSRRNSWDR